MVHDETVLLGVGHLSTVFDHLTFLDEYLCILAITLFNRSADWREKAGSCSSFTGLNPVLFVAQLLGATTPVITWWHHDESLFVTRGSRHGVHHGEVLVDDDLSVVVIGN